VVGLLIVTLLAFGPDLTLHWLQSHQVSDAMYSSGQQGIPSHLITGLPANLMILFPVEQRATVKWPLYFGAALLWAVGFYFAITLAKRQAKELPILAISLIIGVCLSAITLPHLLYYDLCVLVPAGVLLIAGSERNDLRWIAISGWLLVSGFLVPMLAFASMKIIPLILEMILTALLVILLRCLSWPPATPARR